jgi:spore maturation protein B
MQDIGNYIIPLVITLIIIYGLYKRVNVFDVFVNGAREGVTISVKILAPLIGLMTAVAMFKASGALDVFTSSLKPIGNLLGIPTEVLPLAILRPISGSGSLAILENILRTNGPDSLIGRIASVIQGSTETTFYTIAVYYGSINVIKTRHTLPAALTADIVGFIVSIIIVKIIFGG